MSLNSLSHQNPKRLSKIIRGISGLRSQPEKPPIGQRWDKNGNCTELQLIKYFKSGKEGKFIMTVKNKIRFPLKNARELSGIPKTRLDNLLRTHRS